MKCIDDNRIGGLGSARKARQYAGWHMPPRCRKEYPMNLFVTVGRLLDAVVTGIGVVLGLVPDPRFPGGKNPARR